MGVETITVVCQPTAGASRTVMVVLTNGESPQQAPLQNVKVGVMLPDGRLKALTTASVVYRWGTSWTQIGRAQDVMVPGD